MFSHKTPEEKAARKASKQATRKWMISAGFSNTFWETNTEAGTLTELRLGGKPKHVYPLAECSAKVEASMGEPGREAVTLTRVALVGLFALAAKKQKGGTLSEVTLLVKGPDDLHFRAHLVASPKNVNDVKNAAALWQRFADVINGEEEDEWDF